MFRKPLSGLEVGRQYSGVKTISATDGDLLAGYAKHGSEAAFRTLVARHVRLVFATALRQSGNRQLAEEITQNVFVVLARKADRLAGHETIAGWLHRTALLESRARIRAELRRQRREDVAAALARAEAAPESAPDTGGVNQLLDEGLMTLGEVERNALLLRFLEARSFAEVGHSLGVSEEAARKRVDRAIERLAGFFRIRGFSSASNSTALIPFLMSEGAPTLPGSLTAQAASAGLATGKGGTMMSHLVAGLARLTPTQGLVAGLILCLVPYGWNLSGARVDATALKAEQAGLAAAQQALNQARLELESAEADRGKGAALAAGDASNRLPGNASAKIGALPLWDDRSPLLRVSKSYLASLDLYGLRNGRGDLSETLIQVLQMTPKEVAEVESALHRFLQGYHEAEQQVMRSVEPEPIDLAGHSPQETRVFVFGDLHVPLAKLRSQLFDEVSSILGGDRMRIFKRSLGMWMPTDDAPRGLGNSMEIYREPRRERYYRSPVEQPHVPGQAILGWSVALTARGLSFQSTRIVEDLPGYLMPHLQDWIEEARRVNAAPLPKKESQP